MSIDNQRAFDIVVRHLFKQGRPAMSGGECRYRGENGCMCAIGPFIPDAFYTSAMEGKSSRTLGSYYTEIISVLPEPEFGAVLQRVHDAAGKDCALRDGVLTDDGQFGLPALAKRLADVAEKFSLDTGVLADEFLAASRRRLA